MVSAGTAGSESNTETTRSEQRKRSVKREAGAVATRSIIPTEKEVAAVTGEFKKIMDRVKNIDKIVEEIEENRTEFV